MHLKILAQSKIIESDPLVDYSLIADTRKLSENYLNDYEKLPNNEDKYREIYYLNEKLKECPSSSEEFEIYKKSPRRGVVTNEALPNIGIETLMNIMHSKDFKIGLSFEDTYKLYPNFKDNKKVNNPEGGIIVTAKIEKPNQPNTLMVYKNTVIGYYIILLYDQVDDTEFSMAKKVISQYLNILNKEFQFSPKETIKEVKSVISGNDYIVNGINYTWTLNKKLIHLYIPEVNYNNRNSYSIHFSVRDENLIK